MITSSIKQFTYYKQLGTEAMNQVEEEGLFDRISDSENSIAMIVQHLAANMKSRWTNIFEEDGEKAWRDRDMEFEPILTTKSECIALWVEGWETLFETLASLKEEDLLRIIYIRNQGLTVQDAILRQLCHYSYHVGQMVYKAKEIKLESWKSLSIPKNQSKQYNAIKFDKQKEVKHFLDDLIKQDSEQNKIR